MNKARDEALGPRDKRTRERAVLNKDGTYSGGVAFERSMRAKSVFANTRAYTIATSLQKRRSVVSPASSSKLMGDPDDHLIMRHRLLKVIECNFLLRSVLTIEWNVGSDHHCHHIYE